MKTTAKSFILAGMLSIVAACTEVAPTDGQLKGGIDSDYEFTYAIREFVQFDPKNPGGVNLMPYFDFLKTYALKLYVVGGKITAMELDMGDVPFDIYDFPVPDGKVECVFDEECIPNALKLATGETIATFVNGEFVINLVLDCKDLSYRINFKTTETTREGYEKAY